MTVDSKAVLWRRVANNLIISNSIREGKALEVIPGVVLDLADFVITQQHPVKEALQPHEKDHS